MKTKLMLVIPTLVQGGAEKQLALLAAGLPRDRFETSVVVLTHTGPWEEELRRAEIPVTVIGKRWKFDPGAFRRLRRVIAEQRPDIVHTWLFAANSYGRWAAIKERVPVVLGGERCVDLWKRGYEFWIDRYLARRTRGIVTNSEGVRDFYSRHGIDRERFFIIPNGIEPREVDPIAARAKLLEATGLEDPVKLIVAVGRLWPQKRLKDLIWGTELISCVRDDVHLCLIGEGPERWRLERFAAQVKIDPHIHFLGHRADAAQLVAGADQFWIGSAFEGQSNALMEAMRAGRSVVASDIPGNRDLVIDDQTGRLFPLGDRAALARESLKLLEDAEQASALGRGAAEWIQSRCSVDVMVAAHVELYERLMRESRGS